MTTPKTPEQGEQPSINCYTLAHAETIKKPLGSRITAQVVSEIAMLCARCQLSESEACRQLDIIPQTWFSWKSKNSRSEKWAALVEKFRSVRITKLIERVEKSAEGVGLKQPDFRAAMALLTIIDKRRYGQQSDVPAAPQGQVISEQAIGLLCDMARKVYGEIPDTTKPKQIGPIVEVESASTNEIKQIDASQ